MTTRASIVLALAALAAVVACGSSPGGSSDARGRTDAPPAIDSPAIDAAPDAAPDGPTDVPAVPCTDSFDAVYATPASPSALPGAILACAPDAAISMGSAQSQIGSDTIATTDVATFRIAFATRDGSGGPAVSTAEVYLPHVPRARPVPIAVAGHGSVGLADACVPSATVDHNLPLPYAARGFATIAPDLAGLGNAGTQDYLDNRAQGRQLLDGARALRALLQPGLTSPQLILSGYSQGGGAALSAQALIRTDTPNGSPVAGQLVATVVYAPEWPIRLNSFRYADILASPDTYTILFGLSYSSVAVLRQYAWFENHVGAGTGKTSVPSQDSDGLESAVQSQCLVALGGYIQGTMLKLGDLIEPTLAAQLDACIAGDTAHCTGNGAAYYADLIAEPMPSDPQAGPVLLIQGGADQIMLPQYEAACIVDKLRGENTDTSTCVFATSDHSNIMDQHSTGVAWAESVLAGGARAACPSATALPACTP